MCSTLHLEKAYLVKEEVYNLNYCWNKMHVFLQTLLSGRKAIFRNLMNHVCISEASMLLRKDEILKEKP